MSNYTLRRAKDSDVKDLTSCIDAAYAIYAERISDLPDVSEGLHDDIESKIVWVAVQNQTIIGGLILSAEKDFMQLVNIAVHPDASGRGVGRLLIAKAEEETSRHGLSGMQLSTHVDMPENVALYEHLGWEEMERSARKVKMRKFLK